MSSAEYLRSECDRYGFHGPLRVVFSIQALVNALGTMPFEAFRSIYLSVMTEDVFGMSVVYAVLSDFKVSYPLYPS
jgi:hypothetical protein